MSYNINSINNINRINSNYRTEQPKCSQPAKAAESAPVSVPVQSNVNFNGFFSNLMGVHSKLKNKEDRAKYKEIYSGLSSSGKKDLEQLLTAGIILNKNSNDGSSVLDSLYKIKTTERIRGLNATRIIEETVSRLAFSPTVEQKFEKIPDELKQQLFNEEKAAQGKAALPNAPKSPDDLDVTASATCVAASVEFSLADKKPAEYARYIEGLTSARGEVKTKIHFGDINPNLLSALDILRVFNTEHKTINFNDVEVTLKPDRNAFVRARVLHTYPQSSTRNSVDALMQSTFMQLGSQNTYNSLTDKRYGELNADNSGLTEIEKNFVETIVDNNGGKTSLTYQIVDENKRVTGYYMDFAATKKQLLDSLDSGSDVIIGLTETDANKEIIGGHEITLIGHKMKDNELYFVYNDTDDDYVGKLEMKASELIPKIHHAGIPNAVLGVQPQPNVKNELIRYYRELKSQPKQAAKAV